MRVTDLLVINILFYANLGKTLYENKFDLI